jgi:transketolase
MNSKIKLAKKRCSNYRKRLLKISQKVQALHVGGSFSVIEVMDVIYNILKKKK